MMHGPSVVTICCNKKELHERRKALLDAAPFFVNLFYGSGFQPSLFMRRLP
jgi:hypothetical protein